MIQSPLFVRKVRNTHLPRLFSSEVIPALDSISHQQLSEEPHSRWSEISPDKLVYRFLLEPLMDAL